MRKTMTKVGQYRKLWLTALVVILLDQLTKLWILNNIEAGTYNDPAPIPVITGWFYIVHIYNTGAAWGVFSGGSFWFAILAIAVVLGIYFFRKKLELKRDWVQWSMGLLIGGIIGNLIDRLFRGHVIDFLDVHLPGYRWPAFNVADMAIFIGVFLYLLFVIFEPKRGRSSGGGD